MLREESQTDNIVCTASRRFGLPSRAVAVLRALVTDGQRDQTGWHLCASESELATTAGCSPKTASRGVHELERAGIIVAHHRRGRRKCYRVRAEVVDGEASDVADPGQLELTAVNSDPGQLDRGHGGERGGSVNAQLREGEREVFSLEQRKQSLPQSLLGGAGETPVTPSLPTIIHRPDAEDRDVCAATSGWCQQQNRTDVRDVLAAVLAARHANAIDMGAYVAKCFQCGIREHWLRRADVLLTPSPGCTTAVDRTAAIEHLGSMPSANLDAFASRVLTGAPLQLFNLERSGQRDPLKVDAVASQLARKLIEQEATK